MEKIKFHKRFQNVDPYVFFRQAKNEGAAHLNT
jgi:hypothetical protein